MSHAEPANPSGPHPDTSSEVAKTLGLENHATGRWKKILAGILISCALVGLVIWFLVARAAGNPVSYETVPVTMGDLTVVVSTTGTLEARNTVEVGSEISGRVTQVHADFNDQVEAGQLLVELDRDQLGATVTQSAAQLASARAQVRQARATATEARRSSARVEALYERNGGSLQEMESAQASVDRATASVASAAAGVDVAEAALDSARTNLERTGIRAPINGVVLSRTVEPGQSLAAALQAPTLFVIAEDLAHMNVHANVDEADVGQVAAGQEATFTVDAFHGRSFEATVTSVRNTARILQNVVTYETVLSFDNTDLSLRPGMTADVMIVADKRENVMLVPNAALRFHPEDVESDVPRRESGVWVIKDGEPTRIPVVVGATDDEHTEVTSDRLRPGMELIVGALRPTGS